MPSLSRLLLLRGLLRQRPRSSGSNGSSPPSPSSPQSHSPKSTNTNSYPNPNPSSQQPPAPSWIGHPLRLAVSTLKFVAFAHLLWEYGLSMAPASGPSMLPTFQVLGEWLLVSKLHRLGRGISVGDVVAYNIPINDEVGVKRVLGLPGDYVLMDTPENATGTGSMIQVPQGHCWIVGDNLIASRDSRYFGPVPLALIRGKVIATIRPFSEFRWITNPLQRPDQSLDT
ncbi:Mitochondrial inner membrane protease subunit 1 [Madurella mycetomatis]|uniref:Mitochondrial inner membrane protease subunit 1 n=1 Tax=Madurella mycetomatis TaxID=100816 RepID=A0A175WDL4_9PEZI|nr:Mitochondrial inner membrane protease subunit 1 [Madurella mycetomatis]